MSEVRQWLDELGLGQYADAFEENAVDTDLLSDLDDSDLEKLGVSLLGHRKRILKAIATCDSKSDDDSRTSSATSPVMQEAPARAGEVERRQITVMFCDLVGSTKLSETLDPEDLRSLMQAYQQAAGAVIRRYEGHVAQYLGDGLMTYFGWPKAHEDDAERAISAGLDIIETIKSVEGAPEPLQVRVGIASGPVVVGGSGDGDASIPQAAIGETPNIAARLQGLAEADQILIAASSHRLAGGAFDYESLGAHDLKGVADRLPVWSVNRRSQAADRFEARSTGDLTPLTGRQSELAMLTERWEQAQDGEGQVVILTGEPGIGKSRLVRALRDTLANTPYTRLTYQCSPHYTNSAFHPIIAQFERAAGFTVNDTDDHKLDKMETILRAGADDIASAAPLVAAMLSLPTERYPPVNLAPQQANERTHAALVDQVLGLARSEAVLIIFEDAHWSDPTTLDAIGEVITGIQAARVLALITARPEFEAPWSIGGHVAVHSLTRLSRRLGADMVLQVAGGRQMPEDVVDQIIAKTDGVPLFVEELTKTVLETGQLGQHGDAYALEGSLPALTIPETLHDSLMARLDRLETGKKVAQIAACIGRDFSRHLLAEICPLDDRQLDEALNALVDSELIFGRGSSRDTMYGFKHALIRDVAYGSLLRNDRQHIHGEIAGALLSGFPQIVETSPELVAHHFAEATMFDAAIPHVGRAGQRALGRLASQEAIAHFENGLGYLRAGEPTSENIESELELQNGLAMAMTLRYGYSAPETGAAFERAYELAQHATDPPEMFHILYGLSINRMASDRFLEGLKSAKDMLDYAERTDNLTGRVLAHRWYGTMLYFSGDFRLSQSHSERALALYDDAEHKTLFHQHSHDPKAIGLAYLGLSRAVYGLLDQGRNNIDEAIAWGEQLDFPYGVAHVHSLAAFFFYTVNQPVLVDTHTAILLRIAEEFSFPFWESMGRPMAVWACRKDDPMKAIENIEDGIEKIRNLGAGAGLNFSQMLLAGVLLEEGEVEYASRVLQEARSVEDKLGFKFSYAEIVRLQGDCQLHGNDGNVRAAEALFREAMAVARAQEAKLYELRSAASLARLCHSQGRAKEARDLLAPVYASFAEGFDTPDLIDAKALLDNLK